MFLKNADDFNFNFNVLLLKGGMSDSSMYLTLYLVNKNNRYNPSKKDFTVMSVIKVSYKEHMSDNQ